YAGGIAGDKDIIVTMDADASHTPGLILRMVRMVREGHDVVIASRYQAGSVVRGVTYHRRVISWLGSFLMRVTFPIMGVRDYTCGYRTYVGGALKAAMARYGETFVDQDGFQCMVDVLLKLRGMPLIFGEAPLILRYDFKQGASKMRLGRTLVQTLRLLARRRVGRGVGGRRSSMSTTIGRHTGTIAARTHRASFASIIGCWPRTWDRRDRFRCWMWDAHSGAFWRHCRASGSGTESTPARMPLSRAERGSRASAWPLPRSRQRHFADHSMRSPALT